MRMRRLLGFTLLEFLVALGIVGILLVSGVPSFISIMSSNALASATNSLVSTYQYARSEAVKRAQPVQLNPASDRWQVSLAGTSQPLLRSNDVSHFLTISELPSIVISSTGAVTSTGSMPAVIRIEEDRGNSCSIITVLPSGQITTGVESC